MNKKTTKKDQSSNPKSSLNFSGDAWNLIKQILEKTVITVFWESVDDVKKKAKVSLKFGLTFALGVIAIFTGLIFLIIGISQMLDQLIVISPGIGYVICGTLVVVFGFLTLDKAKKEKTDEK